MQSRKLGVGDTTPEGTVLHCTVAREASQAIGSSGRVCVDPGLSLSPAVESLLMNTAGGIASGVEPSNEFLEYFKLYEAEGYTVGSITDLVVEAGDASISGAPVEDGKSGDIAFPHGEIKPIVTAGERSVCPESMGEVVVGKPDGMGAYLVDDDTIRVLFQSESYGSLTANEA